MTKLTSALPICQALRYFGPMDLAGIQDKLRLINIEATTQEVEKVFENFLSGLPVQSQPYYRATGFNGRAYKDWGGVRYWPKV